MSNAPISFAARLGPAESSRSTYNPNDLASKTPSRGSASAQVLEQPAVRVPTAHRAPLKQQTDTVTPADALVPPPTSGSRAPGSLTAGYVIKDPGLQLPPSDAFDPNRPPPPPPILPRARKQPSNIGMKSAGPIPSAPRPSPGSTPGSRLGALSVHRETQSSTHGGTSVDASRTERNKRAGDGSASRHSDQRTHSHGALVAVPCSVATGGAPFVPETAQPSADGRYFKCLVCYARFAESDKLEAVDHVLLKHHKPVFANVMRIIKILFNGGNHAQQRHTEQICLWPGCGARFPQLNWEAVQHVITAHPGRPEHDAAIERAVRAVPLYESNGKRVYDF